MQRVRTSNTTTAYMGNDVNDLECMHHVGLAIAPCDAHPAVLAIADLVTSHRGGRGAIREVADKLVLRQPIISRK